MKTKIPFVLCATTIIVSFACALISAGESPLQFDPDSLPNAQVGAAYETEIQHATEKIYAEDPSPRR